MSLSESDPTPTKSNFGAYHLIEQVATGGSSSIWRASAPDGAIVAIKLLDAMASATDAERRRFLRGFRAAAGLVHPGIARLIEAGEHEGRLFVVQDFVEGATLSEHLRAGALPVPEALRVLRASAEILRYAHEAGVVHRDLSPRNLMIDGTGRVVLVDFGIAVRPEGTTQAATQTLVGTLHYLAPELIGGHPPTPRSDLYSLGAIAYQMLTGMTPFVASTPEALLQHHLQTRPKPLIALRPGLDRRLDRLVLRLLAKDPKDRVLDAGELVTALDAIASAPARARRGAESGAPRTRRTRTARVLRRIVVTPFTADVDDANDPERPGRIARGLAETVAAGLASVEDLTITPPAQVIGAAFESLSDLAERLGADAIISAHLGEADSVRRLSWTLTGKDGSVLAGGRVSGPSQAPFELEDSLLAELIRALRRPDARASLQSAGSREDWYGPFLEAIGCLQRTDDAKQVDRAIELLEAIRDSGAGGVRVHAALGRAYLRRADFSHDATWRQRAEASCRIALGLDPLAPEAMLTMGRMRVSGGRSDEAIPLLERALELEPKNVDVMLLLSRAHESLGNLDEAEAFARRACAERPRAWQAHDRIAVLEYRRGRLESAAEHWHEVTQLVPSHAGAHAKLGAARFQLGDLDEAERQYREALRFRRAPEAVSGLGTVCFYRGQHAEAIALHLEATRLAPTHPALWGHLADSQRWTDGERAHSIASFDRAIELIRAELVTNSSDGRAWASLATYLAKREQHAEATVALQRALSSVKDPAPILASAVVVHELAGRRSEALRALEELRGEGRIPFELGADPELRDLVRTLDVHTVREAHPRVKQRRA